MSAKQGQLVGHGAFQLFSAKRGEAVTEVLTDVFGRDDITAVAADWRGIVYFTLSDDDQIDAATVVGFDPSSGSSGPLASLDEVRDAVRGGDITEAVDGASFDEWRVATGTRALDMGMCVPPITMEFLGGDPAQRAVEPQDIVTFIAVAAALMGRLEALGVQPGEEIPDEIFDDDRWR